MVVVPIRIAFNWKFVENVFKDSMYGKEKDNRNVCFDIQSISSSLS